MIYNENFILRALELAKIGKGFVKTNPLVGAVLVVNNQIIGEGFHQKYGEAHAEVNAINSVLQNFENAAEILKKATLFVTLEPCAHFGKTPPCADLIIKHQIPNVVIGCTDSFAQVNGKGIEKLKNAGVNVTVGVLEEECRKLNERFFTKVQKQRPFVILKWAETANGYFAPENGEQKWISGKEAKLLVHKWRTEEDCILVGKNTAQIDNPKLNVRLVSGKNPKRAVIDKNLELSKDLHLFDQSVETFIFNLNKTKIEGNTKYIGIEDFDYFLPQYILFQLYLQDIQSVIIEGGAQTLQQFIDANLWDEARIFKSSHYWSQGIKSPQINGKQVFCEQIGSDKLIILTP